MSHASRSKTEIRRSIELLNQVTQRDNLKDHASMIEAQRQFQTLRDHMSHTEQAALVLLASLGDRLSGCMYKEKQVGVDEMRTLVLEIAEHVTKALDLREESKSSIRFRKLKLSDAEVRLALRDGQRLGELLVHMTMLTPEQVEAAVKVQRATGQRLGEALLQMRLLTPDMLESALRVQRTKRTANSADHWSTHKRAE